MVQITIDEKRIAAFCRSHQIKHMALFGSVLRDDFRSDSDIDVLVVFAPESRHTLFDLIQIEVELEGILGRKVDLVDRAAVEQSRNYIRRDAILESLEPIYAA